GQALGKLPGVRDEDALDERRMVDEAHVLVAEAIGEHVAEFAGAARQKAEGVASVFGKASAPAAAARSGRSCWHRRITGTGGSSGPSRRAGPVFPRRARPRKGTP